MFASNFTVLFDKRDEFCGEHGAVWTREIRFMFVK